MDALSRDGADVDSTLNEVRRLPVLPTIPTTGTKAFRISANGVDSSGMAETVYLTLTSPELGAPAFSTGWIVDPDSIVDAETMSLVSDVEFMARIAKAERDLAEGRGLSGDELRRRRD